MAKKWAVVAIGKDNEILNKKAVRELFQLSPGKYLVEINSAEQRSTEQNSYYWGVVVWMVRQGMIDMGMEDLNADEVHEFLKGRFNYTELINVETGQMERIPRSTRRLNKLQFMEYWQRIQRFAAEFFNIYIPDPNEDLELELK